MKKIILTLVIISTLITSCKKKEDNAPAPSSTTTGSTPTPSVEKFGALFSNQLVHSIFGATTFTLSYGQNYALASSSNFDNFNMPLGTFLSMGNVSSNGVTFKNFFGYYLDSTNAAQASPFVWQITGGAVAAFTYTNSAGFSTYSNYTSWPDTLSKSAGFSIPLSGITNAAEAQIYISSVGSTTPALTASVVLGSGGSFNVSSSSLSSVSTSTSASIQIDLYRNNVQTINGVKMNFRNVTSYVKTVPVKN